MRGVPSFTNGGDKPAIIMAPSGEVVSHAQLERRSNSFAHLLRRLGLAAGDTVAVCLENGPEFLYVACAAMRSGLIFVPVSNKLTAAEIGFIVRDSEASAFVVSPLIGPAFSELQADLGALVHLVTTSDQEDGFCSWRENCSTLPVTPIKSEALGSEMLYSSGTTGRPKGICYENQPGQPGGVTASVLHAFDMLAIVGEESVYLCPAPLYHSAPYGWSMATLALGGTVVVMERFDAAEALRLIQRHRVTLSQWVPTHFVRLLKLPKEVRTAYDLSSMRLAVHAAAPCPVAVKREMIEWWGPIILEYFGSSEQTALTFIGSEEWLAHPGSVGRCVFGQIHICDDKGEPVSNGTVGQIYSEGGSDFSYNHDPVKTASTRNRRGWTTVGDLGRLDDDGYLYLTDRKGFMIITGGVNVYPQEIENLLVTHPRVADAAVIGLPDDDLGERVVAVVQPLDPAADTEELASELRGWLRERLSGVKCPKQILTRAELPRLPTGKMVKGLLRDRIINELAQGVE